MAACVAAPTVLAALAYPLVLGDAAIESGLSAGRPNTEEDPCCVSPSLEVRVFASCSHQFLHRKRARLSSTTRPLQRNNLGRTTAEE
jgi:hypothetical protein